MVDAGSVLREKSIRTRERILTAAEKLFAEQGFDGASMRGITASAKVNLSVAYYYFKDKENLLHSVLDRYLLPVMEEMRGLLAAAREAAGTAPIPLRRLLDAMVLPRARCLSDTAHRLFTLLFVHRGETEKKIFATLEEKVEPLQRMFLDEFSRTLPHLSELELRFRMESLDVMLYGWRTVGPLKEHRYPKTVPIETFLEMLMTFAEPLFLAPATLSLKKRPEARSR